MALLTPLNDKECLAQLHELVEQYQRLKWVRRLARRFKSVKGLICWIRSLEQRDDLGDPDDGPRLPCNVSQRARFALSDPNCFERVLLFLALALLIDPSLDLTSASMIINEGWHTFPVEIRDGVPRIVVLDPINDPPRNTMAYTAWQARNLRPGDRRTLAAWFNEVVRNACLDEGTAESYRLGMQALRNAITTGEALAHPEHIDHVLELAYRDAQLWGTPGRNAVKRIHGSLRNLAISIDSRKAKRAIGKVASKGKDIAPHIIRAALIAEFGPIAAVALQGTTLGVQAPAQETPQPEPAESPALPESTPANGDRRTVTTFGFSRQERR